MKIVEELLAARKPINQVLASEKTGIYAIFTKRRDCLPGIDIPENGVLYVGQTEDSLEERNHFLADDSGFHSPRRSLGAILKKELKLSAVPRSPGPSKTNYEKYAFAEKGERDLSEWMQQHLDYSTVELVGDLKRIETAVIGAMKPPLNLNKWRPNHQKKYIQNLRNECKAEAEAIWMRSYGEDRQANQI